MYGMVESHTTIRCAPCGRAAEVSVQSEGPTRWSLPLHQHHGIMQCWMKTCADNLEKSPQILSATKSETSRHEPVVILVSPHQIVLLTTCSKGCLTGLVLCSVARRTWHTASLLPRTLVVTVCRAWRDGGPTLTIQHIHLAGKVHCSSSSSGPEQIYQQSVDCPTVMTNSF